jgi:hypothetical protein
MARVLGEESAERGDGGVVLTGLLEGSDLGELAVGIGRAARDEEQAHQEARQGADGERLQSERAAG